MSSTNQNTKSSQQEKQNMSDNNSLKPSLSSIRTNNTSRMKKLTSEALQQHSTSRKNKHSRKDSGASVMSIDPVALLKLHQKNDAKNKNEINDANVTKPSDLSTLSPHSQETYFLKKEKEKLEEELISVRDLRPQLEKFAQDFKDLFEENEENKLEIDRLIREKQDLIFKYGAEIEECNREIEEYEKMLNLNSNENNQFAFHHQSEHQHHQELIQLEVNYQKEIDNVALELKRVSHELETAYNEIANLKQSLNIQEHENQQLTMQINENNKLNQQYKLLIRKQKQTESENEQLKQENHNLQNEVNELSRNQTLLHEEIEQRIFEQDAQVDTLRNTAIDLRSDKNFHKHKDSRSSGGNLSDISKLQNPHQQLLKQSTTKEVEENDESDRKLREEEALASQNYNVDNSPKSWNEVHALLKNKKSDHTNKHDDKNENHDDDVASDIAHNFSVKSNYDDSETNVDAKIDDMNEDIQEIKKLIMNMSTNNDLIPQLQNNIEPLSRIVRQIHLMLRGNPNVNFSNQNSNQNNNQNSNRMPNRSRNKKNDIQNKDTLLSVDDIAESSSEYSDANTNKKTDNESDGWLSWLASNFGDNLVDPLKKSFLQEWLPSMTFSTIILIISFLLLKYHKGDLTFGQPRVLQNNRRK